MQIVDVGFWIIRLWIADFGMRNEEAAKGEEVTLISKSETNSNDLYTQLTIPKRKFLSIMVE